MGLKPGYKQTEVGVIPEEWEVARIADVADVKTGPFGSALHERDYVHDGTPIITVEHLGELGVMTINLPLVSDADRHRLRAYSLDVGDIVFSRVGSVDRNALIRETEAGWLFSGRLLRVRPSKKRAYAPYLSYQFHGESFKRRVRDVAVGQTMASLNTKILSNVKVVLPSLPEQSAIAGALGDVDALIGALDQLIAKKRDLKQAAIQQLLTGKTRLPGFRGKWEAKSIFELADKKKELFDDGDWIEAEFLEESGTRLIQTGNIGQGRFEDKESRKYISPESFTKLRCKGLSVGDILICRLAEPAGRACILPDIGETRLITAVDVTIFRPLPTLADRRFLVHVFSTRDWFSAVNERCGGSTRTRIARGELGRIEVNLPPIDEQSAIAVVLSDMDAEIGALEQRLAKTRALKQGMMQELLTGRTRLPLDEGTPCVA